MPHLTVPLIIICTIAIVVLVLALQNQRRRVQRARQKFTEFEGEEQRLFTFLHELGEAIEDEPSPSVLSRIIVDGVNKVVAARGGAIYFLNAEGKFLNPSYISEECPPLIQIPEEILQKAQRDARALESHLRLTRVAIDDGIFGHCLSQGEPMHLKNLNEHLPQNANLPNAFALLAPLRHAGKSFGILTVARPHDGADFSANDFAVFRSIAEQSAFAIGNARIHREAHEKRAIENELKNAREVQRILLPQDDPQLAGFRISGTNLPARIISGDYYDYIHLDDDKLGVVIADVSGKGVPAGLLMAMCRSALRCFAPGKDSPSEVSAAVNRQLFADIHEDMFISMTYSIIDAKHGTMTLSRAGHDPALLYRKETDKTELLRSPGLALGVDSGTVFERVTKDQVIELKSGDCVLFYTDGVREAVNASDEEFGMERMAEVFRKAAPLGAAAILSELQESLKNFTGDGPQMDDITLVAIEKR